MKKSVALIIALVTIVGVVLVAFFGTAAANIYPTVYISTITMKTMEGNDIEPNAAGMKILNLSFEPDLYDEENNTRYMQYFFVLEFNVGMEPPTTSAVRYSFDTSATDIDGEPLIQPAMGDFTTGAILIKEKKSVTQAEEGTEVPIQDYFFTVTINVSPRDGGNGTGDSVLLLINYGYVYPEVSAG